jgi:hypothetical protein
MSSCILEVGAAAEFLRGPSEPFSSSDTTSRRSRLPRAQLRALQYGIPVAQPRSLNPIFVGGPVHVRFVSSLIPEDEDRFAPGLLQAIRALLDCMPITYTVRIETETGTVLQHHHTADEAVAVFPGAASSL